MIFTMEPNPHFLLIGNGPFSNRGCEAIVRGTMVILRQTFGNDIRVTLLSYCRQDEIAAQIRNEKDPGLRHVALHPARWSAAWLQKQLHSHLWHTSLPVETARFNSLLPGKAAVLAVGGDNYSLNYGRPVMYMALDKLAMARAIPLILWGASVGPFDTDPQFKEQILEHLKKFSRLLVREEVSRQYLEVNGASENLHLVADPAFLMPPAQPQPNKLGFEIPQQAIGINLSPLLGRQVMKDHHAEWTGRCTEIVAAVANRLAQPIMLIPHATRPADSDYKLHKSIVDDLPAVLRARVRLVPDTLDAAETKALISCCAIFIGARTHATIAAFATATPVLSLAYSIKSVGLNQSLYGHQQYCLLPEEITPQTVAARAQLLAENTQTVRRRLAEQLPEINRQSLRAGELLQRCILSAAELSTLAAS
jgi:colanic acid/amylovoran biosynthesis protein